MRKNWVREKLRAGEPALGAFLGLGSPNAAELMAHAGYDWLAIEAEHSPLDLAQVEHMLMALNGTDTIPIVRVPSAEPLFIQRVLDAGSMGILVPMTRSAAEAEAIVSATRYPPEGRRGFGPLRASHYTMDYPDYFASANENILIALIIETSEALHNLEEIAAVPGIDALFFGLFDLCLSLGLNPMDQPFAQVDEAVAEAVAICQKMGVAIGIGSGTPEELRRRRQEGFTFQVYGTDYQLLGDAARAGVELFRRL